MIEHKIEELIQLEIDGQNAPEDSARLKAILESDAEARRYFQRLQSVAEDLTELGLVSAPIDLRGEIEQTLAQHDPGITARPARSVRRSFSTREIFAFATGIAAGLALFAVLSRDLLPGQELDPRTLSGSMVLNPQAGTLPVIDQHSFEDANLRAEVLIRSDHEFVVAEIDLHAPGSLSMALEYDPSALALVGCERPAAEAGEVLLGSRELRVKDPQEGPYRFVFRKRAEQVSSPLHLRLDRGAWSARESLRITPSQG